MLLFYATFSKRPFADGPLAAPGEPFRLYRSLYEAEKAARAPGGKAPRFLALDAERIHLVQPEPPAADQIPQAAALNADADGRITATKHVEAAGGLVLRIKGPTEKKPERRRRLQVLLIFRRGAWDLPKGKLDPGESPLEGGHREVCEEVGIKTEKATGAGDARRDRPRLPAQRRLRRQDDALVCDGDHAETLYARGRRANRAGGLVRLGLRRRQGRLRQPPRVHGQPGRARLWKRCWARRRSARQAILF